MIHNLESLLRKKLFFWIVRLRVLKKSPQNSKTPKKFDLKKCLLYSKVTHFINSSIIITNYKFSEKLFFDQIYEKCKWREKQPSCENMCFRMLFCNSSVVSALRPLFLSLETLFKTCLFMSNDFSHVRHKENCIFRWEHSY